MKLEERPEETVKKYEEALTHGRLLSTEVTSW